MLIAGDGGDHDGAAAAASWVRGELAEDPFHDRRGAMLDGDRELAVVPCLSDVPQWWHEHRLHHLDHGRSFVDQTTGDLQCLSLVTRDERLVHPFRLPVEPLGARSLRLRRGA